ncbi:MAG: CIA30 family protein [Cyanobacteria bacterium J06638_22]
MAYTNFQFWNIRRLLQTLCFFEAVPFISRLPFLRDVMGHSGANAKPSSPPVIQSSNDEMVKVLFDYTQPDTPVEGIWGSLDDVVMGGVSESQVQQKEGSLCFEGNLSTANSGGFTSIRTRNFEPPLDVSEWAGVELRVQGDGNRYKFFLRSETRWDGVAHAQSFDTSADEWITVRLPFSAFRAVFRARTVEDQPLNTAHVYALQLMLSKFEYDRDLNPHFKPGAFRLQVQSIGVYR